MTQAPATVNFRLYPHATFSETTVLKDCDGETVDLSNRTALMHIRRRREDADPLFELSTENGSITLGDDGTIAISIAASATSPELVPAIDPDGEVWFHDLLLTDPSTTPETVERTLQGVVIVSPGVTTPT